MRQALRLDPAVAAALGDGEQREKLRAMTPGQRKAAARQKARHKVTFDLSPAVVERLQAIAAKEECSVSSLAGFLLLIAMEKFDEGKIDIWPFLRESRSPRFRYVVMVGRE